MSAFKLIPAGLAGIILCVGCTNKMENLQEDFGKSYRNMVEAQIYNPDAARNPPLDPPMSLDGEKGELILKTYRETVGTPKAIERDIKIQIGTGRR